MCFMRSQLCCLSAKSRYNLWGRSCVESEHLAVLGNAVTVTFNSGQSHTLSLSLSLSLLPPDHQHAVCHTPGPQSSQKLWPQLLKIDLSVHHKGLRFFLLLTLTSSPSFHSRLFILASPLFFSPSPPPPPPAFTHKGKLRPLVVILWWDTHCSH